MEACGLKYLQPHYHVVLSMSRLMEACGLKLSSAAIRSIAPRVTPYGGVWIEIILIVFAEFLPSRHALWRRVD